MSRKNRSNQRPIGQKILFGAAAYAGLSLLGDAIRPTNRDDDDEYYSVSQLKNLEQEMENQIKELKSQRDADEKDDELEAEIKECDRARQNFRAQWTRIERKQDRNDPEVKEAYKAYYPLHKQASRLDNEISEFDSSYGSSLALGAAGVGAAVVFGGPVAIAGVALAAYSGWTVKTEMDKAPKDEISSIYLKKSGERSVIVSELKKERASIDYEYQKVRTRYKKLDRHGAFTGVSLSDL
jgi:hypothetical protein